MMFTSFYNKCRKADLLILFVIILLFYLALPIGATSLENMVKQFIIVVANRAVQENCVVVVIMAKELVIQ